MWQEVLTQPIWGTVGHRLCMKTVTPKYKTIRINSLPCMVHDNTPDTIFHLYVSLILSLWRDHLKLRDGVDFRRAEGDRHSRWFVFRSYQTQGQRGCIRMSHTASIFPSLCLTLMDANAENQCDSGEWSFPNYSVRANARGLVQKRILIQEVWTGACSAEFLANSL